ncbi:MAG: TonB-dependent receptor [Desulfatitalea sp.]|nr:TonB-dependent receptor [Desulfatitalea sp.]NNJ98958.1 TonB-dependent receptor [Desulfatitalea sp.]
MRELKVLGIATVLILTCLLVTTAPARSWADTEAFPDRPEPLAVTAGRDRVTLAGASARVVVIHAKDFARYNARNVPEVLAAAGLHVSDINANQRSYQVDLRGFGRSAPASLLVMVDGRRLTLPQSEGTDWSVIPFDQVSRIEIISGPRTATLYGDNAAVAVVHIITRRGDTEGQGRISGHYGSYNNVGGAVDLGGSRGKAVYDLSANYLHNEGYRDNSQAEAFDTNGRLTLAPSDIVHFHFNGGFHTDQDRLPGAIKVSAFDTGVRPSESLRPQDYTDTQDYFLGTAVEFFFPSNDTFRLDGVYRIRNIDVRLIRPDDTEFFAESEIETISLSPYFAFQEGFGDVSNSIVFGADFFDTKEKIADAAGHQGHLEKYNVSYYVHDDLGVTPQLTLSGGYRYDRATFDLSEAGEDAPGTTYYTKTERRLSGDAFDVGISYAVGLAKAYAGYGRSQRYPLLEEFFNRRDFRLNTALRAQMVHHWEAGAQMPMGDHLILDVNLFSVQTEDEIIFDSSTAGFRNADADVQRTGFEIGWMYRRQNWAAGAIYTYTEARIDGGRYDCSTVPDVPRHRAAVHVGYTFPVGLFMGLNSLHVGQRYFVDDLANSFSRQNDYTVVNAKITYTFRGIDCFLHLNNIFNETYSAYGIIGGTPREPAVFPSGSFNAVAGVTMRYPAGGGK